MGERRAADVLARAVPNRSAGWYLRVVRALRADPTPAAVRTRLEQAIQEAWDAGDGVSLHTRRSA